MRFIALILIMLIGLSGYTAAAHAFADADGHAQTHAVSDGQVNDGQAAPDASKAPCLDCTHCCVSHAIDQSVQSAVAIAPVSQLNAPPIFEFYGEYVFSLIRPPRTLA